MNTTVAPHLVNMSAQFLVSDLARSIDFYTKQLEFTLDFRFEDFYAGISRDGCSIHLKIGSPNKDERRSKRVNDHLDLLFGVFDIDSFYKDICDRSVEVTQALRDMPYGREFYISDPNGYLLGFIQAEQGAAANP